MCKHHRYRLTSNDKRLLESFRIKPHQCHICEQEAELQKRLPPPKLKIEEKNGES